MEHWAKSFFEKITLKHLQNTFGHFWEWFWAFLEFWNFFDFFENFRRLDPPWNTGQKKFRKSHPITSSKHVWTLLGTILGMFGFLNFFCFWKISFGHFCGRFWAFLEVWKFFDFFENFRLDTSADDFWNFWNFETFLIFLKLFEDSTLHGTLGKFFFPKNHLKTCSKHVWTLLRTILGFFGILKFFLILKNFVWTLLGTILGIFGNLKLFWFFWKFSITRPSMEHWAKKFFEKITPKHV